ncbi:MAG: NAD(P)-dependent oxidoreductase [Chloroflexi bacterium]|jgi:3-hydroxyisobutyrate dehydrogenase-like beta-hydroxyacid dehydrogenase|nr:NAD(P)-dependent oxidoreductase [Chloroflexota bacterium]
MTLQNKTLGFIGLGSMGGGIAVNLVKAGYDVVGYDLRPEAVQRFVEHGGRAGESSESLVDTYEYILTCVEGKDSIRLADEVLLPRARAGQTFIDHSTVPCPQTRRIGAAFIAKGCRYLDAPISGGTVNAWAGRLRLFVGGDKATAEECWPLFEAAGNPEKVVYCGERIGDGQVAKVVQQLTVRWPDVARMEVMVFGLRGGIDLETVMRALDVDPASDDPYAQLYRAIKAGKTDDLSALFSEWAYFLEEAEDKGFRVPMLEAMYEFMKDAPLVSKDPLGRPMPSIWNELMKAKRE